MGFTPSVCGRKMDCDALRFHPPPPVTPAAPEEMNSSTSGVTKNASSRPGIFHKETKALGSSDACLLTGRRVAFFFFL